MLPTVLPSSNTNSSIDNLSLRDQERVADIVETCMVSLEEGKSVEIERLAAQHPDLAEPLRRCLASLQTLHDAVHGSQDTIPNHPAFEVGGTLGDFVLESVIGRGGMGVVYTAHQTSLDRRVALKLLPTNAISSPKHVQRFLLEARSAAQLQHPHIVPIYSVGEASGVHYYAMQWIDGHSLEKHPSSQWNLNHCKPFLDAAIDIGLAIQHAHDCGILHRDIKPSNLLMDHLGKVWVADFGLARRMHDQSLTLTGEVIGSVNYMSPEQAMGKPVDERTDIYSLGVTFYEMLTGHQAFRGRTYQETLRQIEHDAPALPRKFVSAIPFDLETVVLKAMSKDREDRYTSALDLASDLIAIRDGRPIVGRRPSLIKRSAYWLGNHKPLVSVALLGIVATLLTFVIGSVKVWQTRNDLTVALIESDRHLQTAKDNYWQGRNLLDRWNENLLPELVAIPGAEHIRSQMLTDTIDYYESFLAKSANDSFLNDDITTARLQLASAYQQAGRDRLASARFEAVIVDITSEKQEPSVKKLRQLALAHNDLALLKLRANDEQSAINNLRRAIEINKTLITTNPKDADRLADVAAAYINLTQAYHAIGDDKLASIALQQAENHYREAILLAPQRTDLQSELGAALDHKAVSLSPHDLPGAIKAAAEGAELHASYVCEGTNLVLPMRRLGASLHNLAALQSKADSSDAARESFKQAVVIREKVTRSYPTEPGHWSDLAISYNGLAMLDGQVQAWNEAEFNFKKASETLRYLVDEIDREPVVSHHLALASTLTNIVRLALQQGEFKLGHPSHEQIDALLNVAEKTASSEEDLALIQKAREDFDDLGLTLADKDLVANEGAGP